MIPRLSVRWLGRVSYGEAMRLQHEIATALKEARGPETLLLLEHPPVVTLGRRADRGNVLVEDAVLSARGIELHEADRGGDATYHGPGQLVGYPILALRRERRDLHQYLRDLEEALIVALSSFGLAGRRIVGRTGVWVGDKKVAAIGVRVQAGWITSHGFSLNVDADLSGFEVIVPCGIRDAGVTSLARLTGRQVDVREAAEAVVEPLARTLGYRVVAPAPAPEWAAAVAG